MSGHYEGGDRKQVLGTVAGQDTRGHQHQHQHQSPVVIVGQL